MLLPEMLLVEKVMLALVVSFFVLIGVTRTDSKNLKTFGRILAITLCLIAILATIFLIYSQRSEKYPKIRGHFHKSEMMKCR
jgi:cell division protein FtsW (lipid II flippase)